MAAEVAAEVAAEAADLGGNAETDAALVAREEHRQVRVPNQNPSHLALLAVHEFVAVGKGLALTHIEHLLIHLVAAQQCLCRHLRLHRRDLLL